MRDYQRQRNNEYYLPNAVYKQVLWQIRDYYRMREELQRIMDESPPPPDGMPHGSGKGQPVESIVIRRERYADKVRAIDDALEEVPEEYRSGIWQHIVFFKPYPKDADRTTYWRWKAKFLFDVAEKLNLT